MNDHRSATPPRSLDCQRRTVLRGAAGLVLAWLTPIRASAQEVTGPAPAAGDLLVQVGDANLIPLTAEDVPYDGRGVMAWAIAPQASDAKTSTMYKILVARLNPATLSGAAKALAADDIVAYSAICTHAGCEVDISLGGNDTIFCSCHSSTFDPRFTGAVAGGPARRPLPALPLKMEAARLVVAAPFTSAPGYGG